MKPRHKALALAHAAAPAEAGADDLRAALGADEGDAPFPPFRFAAGASTSAAAGGGAGGAPLPALSAKRERKAGRASRGGATASRSSSVLPQAATAPPPQAATAADEPSLETKRMYKGVYWCVTRQRRLWAPKARQS